MNVIIAWILLSAATIGVEPTPNGSSYPALPFGGTTLDYWADSATDPVVKLKQRIAAGEVTLAWDDHFGVLPALLRELKIAPSSQVLKFATGSPHSSISPMKPRAIYFREDVAVAWFPRAGQIELAVQIPRKGTLFYSLIATADAPPRWQRPQICLACHVGPNTGTNVPGWQLHVGVGRDAVRTRPWQNVLSHALPFEHRWGQTYVTWESDATLPSGKSLRADQLPWKRETYLEATSDPAALLVRDHWLLGMNLLTRWSFEHQLGQPRDETTTALVRYLLMIDEVPLPVPIPADTVFTKLWQAEGKRDAEEHSLRDLELRTRTFRYAVSPLLLTAMVQEQPREMRLNLYRAIAQQLSNRHDPSEAARIAETLDVLAATVPDWPAE